MAHGGTLHLHIIGILTTFVQSGPHGTQFLHIATVVGSCVVVGDIIKMENNQFVAVILSISFF